MKSFLTFALLIISLLTFSQSPYQIADTSKKWNVFSYGIGSWGYFICGGTKCNKMGEVVYLGDDLYFNVMESEDSLQLDWDYNGYLREDTINKLVYYARSTDEIGLIYDFDINVGDTVNIFNYHVLQGFSSTLICYSIDTVIINGSSKKRYSFYHNYLDPENPDEVWIDGIGSLYGVLNSGIGGSGYVGGGFDLLCCSQNDTIIYMNSFYGSCYINKFFPQILSESYDTAFLNTFYEFQLQIDTGNAESFILIDQIIPEDFNFDPFTGLLTGIPSDTGSFTCMISALNYEMGGWWTDFLINDIPVVLPTNIKEQTKQSNIKIYPNPCSKTLYVENQIYKEEGNCIEVFNSVGTLIDKKIFSGNTIQIDIRPYNTGLYLVKITDNKHRPMKFEKVIIK